MPAAFSTGEHNFYGADIKNNFNMLHFSQFLCCPSLYNPADFYIKSIMVKSPSDEKRIELMIDAFEKDYAIKFDFLEIEYNGLLLKQRFD